MRSAPAASIATPRMRGRALHDALDLGDGVELEPLHDAEAIAQRRGQQSGARGGADQRERRQIELDRARRRALADHDVELIVLHRRIEHLLDHRAQAMDLIDEQHVARLQIGQDRRQVAGPLQHRTGGLAQVDAQLGGDDVRQRGLAQARRTEDQHVIERLGAHARRVDEDRQLRLDRAPGRCSRPARAAGWPDRSASSARAAGGARPAARSSQRAHARTAPCSARRISSSVVSAGARRCRPP